MARACDFDAVHEKAIVHIAAPILPACLGVAEKVGGISGKDFITALVLGMEIMARLGLSLEKSFLVTGFQITNHMGTFGAAFATGKLLQLNPKKMTQALGIAYGQVAGTLQAVIEGSVMVRIQQGFAAQTGVLSAILAERGIAGPQEVFQGKFGYFPIFCQDRYDPSIITRDLGKQFEITNVSIKSFPCCFLNHFAISAMLNLRKREQIDPSEVDQIKVRVNQGAYNVVCNPLERKRNPCSQHEALFSLPYTVAVALLRGNVSIGDFTQESIQDKDVRSIANKVTPVVDENIEKKYGRIISPAVVEVNLKSGKQRSCRVDLVKGHPKNPMTMEECEEKFRNCLRFSKKPITGKKISSLISAVRGLETLNDVSRIVDCLK
jgi:2-methylcitrate dehydratase PrpD